MLLLRRETRGWRRRLRAKETTVPEIRRRKKKHLDFSSTPKNNRENLKRVWHIPSNFLDLEIRVMDKEGKSHRGLFGAPEADFLLQWGNRKRLRCVKVRDASVSDSQKRTTSRVNRRVIRVEKDAPSPSTSRRPSNPLIHRAESGGSQSRKSSQPPSSPDKEENRFYSTRGSVLGCGGDADEKENGSGKGLGENGGNGGDDKWGAVLPRFFISLSSKEKEEDFLAMKGCKLPQRPKKRAKLIQKTILLVSPGAWLSDLSQERYEVREKKSSRKQRRRGLKAMSMESDSE